MTDEKDPGRSQRDIPTHGDDGVDDGPDNRDGLVSGAHRADPLQAEVAPDSETRMAVQTAEQTQAVGRRLARLLQRGDLVVLTGDLGAGKTTLAQGIGDGMGVRGDVTSPTFVIARVHPPLRSGPPLVHVDAYRLATLAEVDDLDLDASLSESVTVVEWGEGLVEELAADRLEVTITMPPAGEPGETRLVTLAGIGERWASAADPRVVPYP
jgi:tRNA threonylcarbamoyladenosine biosynthesis protein TsaE